jgi:hypothetical protein
MISPRHYLGLRESSYLFRLQLARGLARTPGSIKRLAESSERPLLATELGLDDVPPMRLALWIDLPLVRLSWSSPCECR